MDKKLYIVTCYKREDLDSLYNDLESTGGCDCIPERAVECSLRRPLSRNTHYYLTEEEAKILKKDPRVWDVELPPEELGLSFDKQNFKVSQTGDFDKSDRPSSSSVNWGLQQAFQRQIDFTWGSNATPVKTSTIEYNLTGKDVDIVIVDDTLEVNHPDFAVNTDGTGGSRVQAINWYDYNSFVTGLNDLDGQTLPTGTYRYLVTDKDDHSTPVASMAAGGVHGLAKDANIYNIEFLQPKNAYFQASTNGSVLDVGLVYNGSAPIAIGDRVKGPGITGNRFIMSFGTGTGGVGTYNLSSAVSSNVAVGDFTTHYPGTWELLFWDYIRAFHRNKTVNPQTGKRNPTIANCSFGLNLRPSLSDIDSIVYRGTFYSPGNYSPWTLDELYSAFGVVKETSSNAIIPGRYSAFEADLQDAIDDGIVIVSSGGNNNNLIVKSGDIEYDNVVRIFNTEYAYHRGDVFCVIPDVLIVGAAPDPTSTPYKSTFSACGNRVDLFAPGENTTCAAAFTDEFGNITEWEVNSNVVTFKIEEPTTDDDILSELVGKSVEIFMDTTTSLDGTYVVQSASFEPLKVNATIFTVNKVYPDTAQTFESGFVIGNYTTNGRYPIDQRAPLAYIATADGTSFSCPLASGVIACLMQIYRRLDYEGIIGLLYNRAAFQNMFNMVTMDYSNTQGLRGAPNLIVNYQNDPSFYSNPEERYTTGLVYPKNNYRSRFDFELKGHNSAYPRVSNYR